MGRRQVIGMMLGFLVAVAGVTGCARQDRPGAVAEAVATASVEAPAPDADIYLQVLRRYLGTPSENSFPGRTWPLAYVMDNTFTDAADPMSGHKGGVPLSQGSRLRIAAAMAPTTRIVFVADRSTVIETKEGCPQVKDGAVLVTLGDVRAGGDAHKVTVGVNGFVACLGATWLTYVVQDSGGGWQVTGTTGDMAIA